MRNFRIAPYSFQQQYVAPPLEFLQNQLDKRQQSYDRNVFAYNEALGKLAEEAAYDPNAKAEYLKRVSGDYDQVYNKYKGDMATATTDILGVINRARGDEYRNANAAALEKQKQFEQIAMPLRAQGISLEFKGLPSSLTTTDENGRQRYLRREEMGFDVEGMKDYGKEMRDIWTYALHPESGSTKGKLADAEAMMAAGRVLLELPKTSWEGINNTQVKNKAQEALAMYKMTDAYKQQVKKLTQLDGVPSVDVADRIIASEMLAAGNLKKYMSSRDDSQIISNPMAGRGSSRGSGNNYYESKIGIPIPQREVGIEEKAGEANSIRETLRRNQQGLNIFQKAINGIADASKSVDWSGLNTWLANKVKFDDPSVNNIIDLGGKYIKQYPEMAQSIFKGKKGKDALALYPTFLEAVAILEEDKSMVNNTVIQYAPQELNNRFNASLLAVRNSDDSFNVLDPDGKPTKDSQAVAAYIKKQGGMDAVLSSGTVDYNPLQGRIDISINTPEGSKKVSVDDTKFPRDVRDWLSITKDVLKKKLNSYGKNDYTIIPKDADGNRAAMVIPGTGTMAYPSIRIKDGQTITTFLDEKGEPWTSQGKPIQIEGEDLYTGFTRSLFERYYGKGQNQD